MELSLKKARKLEGKIQEFMNSVELSPTVEIRARANSPIAEVNAAKEKLLSNVAVFSNLNATRFQIRKLIGEVNEKVGINALVNERLQLMTELTAVSRLAAAPVSTEDEIRDMVEVKKTQLASGQDSYHLRVTVPVNVLSESASGQLKHKVKGLRTRIEEVEDELVQKNAGAKITLSESAVRVLKEFSLL